MCPSFPFTSNSFPRKMEVSYLQRRAQLSRFDHDARIQEKLESNIPTSVPPPVPLLNPQTRPRRLSNEHADWAGNVPQANARKQFSTHSAQATSIQPTPHGIVPSEDARLCEHNFNTRKHFKDDIRYRGLNQQTPISNAYQCGPGEDHSASHWKTSYQTDIENRGGTQKDQYLAGKGANRAGKKRITPAYEFSTRTKAHGSMQNSGYRSIADGGNRSNSRSLLAGIGSAVLTEVSRWSSDQITALEIQASESTAVALLYDHSLITCAIPSHKAPFSCQDRLQPLYNVKFYYTYINIHISYIFAFAFAFELITNLFSTPLARLSQTTKRGHVHVP